MKKVYSTREEYLPGYPIKDGGGWYTTVEDDEFETYFEQGKIFEKDGLYYSDVQQLNKKPENPQTPVCSTTRAARSRASSRCCSSSAACFRSLLA